MKQQGGRLGRPPKRQSGVPYTQVELNKRYLAKKKRRDKEKAEAERRSRRIQVNDDLGIHIRKIAIADIAAADLASGSVDAVIADPPYEEVALPLWGELGRFAMRVLRPSGWCLAMTGGLYTRAILSHLAGAGLIEHDLIYVHFTDHHARHGPTRRYFAIRPVVVFQKPPAKPPPGEWTPNLITAPNGGQDTSLHPMQQSQAVFEKLVEYVTRPGDLVVDPVAGSGTTLRAALAVSCRQRGSDIDA
jgi:hypothetical protein